MQTDEEVAEMIARFRTPPNCGWEDLRNDIVTLLKSRREVWEMAERERCAQIAISFGDFAGPPLVKDMRIMCGNTIADKIRERVAR